MTILKKIKEELFKAEYESAIEPSSDEIPWERLLLYLGADEKGRERILEITAQQQELGAEISDRELPEMARIQFAIELPFEIKDQTYPDISATLLFLNRMLELPGFELDELQGKVLYRYVLLTSTDPLIKELYLSIIGIVDIFLNLYSELLEKVALGEMSYDELLAQILKAAQDMGAPE